ncbi:MAG: MerR family transcriptional regulator [Candidatus Delongbacteria bacterium]|nr:MerR family transcriptional regulator [Candidatus Delongbacteria bacterium]MBN2835956.1 MerR family transcriptional regulator [Candidatus Delongbacteria bacterium]
MKSDFKKYTIGEVSKMTGVQIKTLQRWVDKKYEGMAITSSEKRAKKNAEKNQQLIEIEIDDKGYRFFTRKDIEKILVINLYRDIGMSYEDIRLILNDEVKFRDSLILHQKRLRKIIDHNEKNLRDIKSILRFEKDEDQFIAIQELSQRISPITFENLDLTKKNITKPVLLENFVWNDEGALKSCLDFLGIDITNQWLLGPSLFVLNIHEDVIYDGMEKWYDGYTGRMDKLKRDLGIHEIKITANKIDPYFRQNQKIAFDEVKEAINNNFPVYAWELENCEYYIINGYSETGYFYSGPDCPPVSGPKHYEDLADSNWGWLEVHIVHPGSSSSNIIYLKEVIEIVLDHSKNLPYWIQNGFKSGLEAYDLWIEGIVNNRADFKGVASNISFWTNRRKQAISFLIEADNKTENFFHKIFVDLINLYNLIYNEFLQMEYSLLNTDEAIYQLNDKIKDDLISGLGKLRKLEESAYSCFEKLLVKVNSNILPPFNFTLKNEKKDHYSLERLNYDLFNKYRIDLNESEENYLLKRLNDTFSHILVLTKNSIYKGFISGKIKKDKINNSIAYGHIDNISFDEELNKEEILKNAISKMKEFFVNNEAKEIFLDSKICKQIDFVDFGFEEYNIRYRLRLDNDA